MLRRSTFLLRFYSLFTISDGASNGTYRIVPLKALQMAISPQLCKAGETYLMGRLDPGSTQGAYRDHCKGARVCRGLSA